jgi:hypothetical protein
MTVMSPEARVLSVGTTPPPPPRSRLETAYQQLRLEPQGTVAKLLLLLDRSQLPPGCALVLDEASMADVGRQRPGPASYDVETAAAGAVMAGS